MQCLIDADVLRYEIGFSGEYVDDDGNPQVREFDFVCGLLDQKIKIIEAECWATEPSILFLSACKTTHKQLNRRRKNKGEKPKKYEPNFREKVATTKVYKGTRKNGKPFHYANLTAYILENYNCVVAEGLEADDLLSVHQTNAEPLTTIICSRDKDLKITPGMHFSWTCGRQPQWGPDKVTELGQLEMKGKKLSGTGLKFFYSQLLTGDTTDNIPGLPKAGPVKAYKLLADCKDEEGLWEAVSEAYKDKIGDDWRTYMREQADLLWMVRELDEEGQPVRWVMYDER